MFMVNAAIGIPEKEFTWRFVRSSGPGGQNVNKVASKAVLFWNLADTTCLAEEVKERLRQQNSRRITTEGILIVSSQRYRDQDKNRHDCLEKLKMLILRAAARPKVRKRTRPSRGSQEARLRAKKHRAAAKGRRRLPEE